jgi:hypothetical protein
MVYFFHMLSSREKARFNYSIRAYLTVMGSKPISIINRRPKKKRPPNAFTDIGKFL